MAQDFLFGVAAVAQSQTVEQSFVLDDFHPVHEGAIASPSVPSPDHPDGRAG